MEFYQSPKWKALFIIPKISGSLSVVGSLFIIRDVLRKENRQKRLKVTTNRIVTLMSIIDVMFSFFVHVLGPWMVPREYNKITGVGAAGNQGTCTFQGFVSNFGGATTGLNAALSITYILVVRYGWKDDRLQKPLMSFVLLGIPVLARIVTGIWALIDQAFNWGGSWSCHVHPAPLGCSESGDPYPCERGTEAPKITLAIVILNQACFAIILILTVALYWTVLQKERATDRFAVDQSQRSRKYSKRVAMQGVWYAGSYFLNFIIWWIYIVLGFAKVRVPYWLAIMMAITLPLQGFWNAIVYFRPRYVNKKRNGSSLGSSLRQSGSNIGSSQRQSAVARHAIGLFSPSRFSLKMSFKTDEIDETQAMRHMSSSAPPLAGVAGNDVFNDEDEKWEENEVSVPNEMP